VTLYESTPVLNLIHGDNEKRGRNFGGSETSVKLQPELDNSS
jgi:hypothetical protein